MNRTPVNWHNVVNYLLTDTSIKRVTVSLSWVHRYGDHFVRLVHLTIEACCPFS